jgi:hypothetical protein
MRHSNLRKEEEEEEEDVMDKGIDSISSLHEDPL